ncbi:hypothetical protein COMNV_01516 [Commensalibacter sp. Nvir]|uniref:dihydropteroate synthase n=1 Tax=Commensalibacter sp. Nvir TaxID=3069817 RepID=UPI002D652D5F|nr:hypothetical protein COMNV_01516 [Commensalibacter sp. Nvir]
MYSKTFYEPLAFLRGNEASTAVAQGMALPFLGQNLSFTMVRSIHPDGSSIYPIGCLPKEGEEKVKQLTYPLPNARLPAQFLIMGILNVTPDSFSDGGKFFSVEKAVRGALDMIEEGADIIDIGGESTRPGSQAVSPQEECSRVIPVIKALRGCGALLSIDTRHAYTMAKALDAGVQLINDISALSDEKSLSIVSQATCPVILMHMRGTPQTMGNFTIYDSLLYDVLNELSCKINKAEEAGIVRERIIIDPGIGFSKQTNDNYFLLKHLYAFASLGCRMMLGLSRKKLIKEAVQNETESFYDLASGVLSSRLLNVNNGIVRVHNVKTMNSIRRLQVNLH